MPSRDMTQAQFEKACAEYGFKPLGYMGYYQLPIEGMPEASRTHVSVWNAGDRRRDQLAYLISELSKAQEEIRRREKGAREVMKQIYKTDKLTATLSGDTLSVEHTNDTDYRNLLVQRDGDTFSYFRYSDRGTWHRLSYEELRALVTVAQAFGVKPFDLQPEVPEPRVGWGGNTDDPSLGRQFIP